MEQVKKTDINERVARKLGWKDGFKDHGFGGCYCKCHEPGRRVDDKCLHDSEKAVEDQFMKAAEEVGKFVRAKFEELARATK